MRRSYIVAASLVLFLVTLTGLAWAGSSASCAINWQVLSGGGAPASVGTAALKTTLGQTAVGVATSSSYGLSSGYWVGASAAPTGNSLYLPVVRKD